MRIASATQPLLRFRPPEGHTHHHMNTCVGWLGGSGRLSGRYSPGIRLIVVVSWRFSRMYIAVGVYCPRSRAAMDGSTSISDRSLAYVQQRVVQFERLHHEFHVVVAFLRRERRTFPEQAAPVD